uniref:Uncharacterized protein n=1 Tax=Anguilla anguilla TaxID=7936 RepID=A0A0E9R9C5_ANGAN
MYLLTYSMYLEMKAGYWCCTWAVCSSEQDKRAVKHYGTLTMVTVSAPKEEGAWQRKLALFTAKLFTCHFISSPFIVLSMPQ